MENPAGLTGLDPETLQALTDSLVSSAVERICQVNQSQGGLHMARAWLYQRARDKARHGDQAPHYVGYRDPSGNKQGVNCGAGPEGLKTARHLRQRIEAELITGTFRAGLKVQWAQFRREYESKILAGKARKTQIQARKALDNFERIINPKKVSAIRTATLDAFTAARRLEKGRWTKRTIAPASVNADLRCIKAALAVADDWGYLQEAPKVRLLKAPRRLPRYLPPGHFTALYRAAGAAHLPKGAGIDPADWWRGLLVLIYVGTGWRIGQCLELHREDVAGDLAVTRCAVEGNKAKADRQVKLHPLAVEHLGRLKGLGERVFPWPHNRRTLDVELHRLQDLAGIPAYGWHALRKGFGTMNAGRMDPKQLQHLMQHASLQTTMDFYVNPMMAQEETVAKLFVPPGLTGGNPGETKAS